jgi:hypothetical protein
MKILQLWGEKHRMKRLIIIPGMVIPWWRSNTRDIDIISSPTNIHTIICDMWVSISPCMLSDFDTGPLSAAFNQVIEFFIRILNPLTHFNVTLNL